MSASTLQREVRKKKPFDLPEQEAFLNIIRTASVLAAEFESLFREHGLSDATYNALRILRGEGGSATCGEIGERLVAVAPDVTRLVDRLERLGMVERRRDAEDKRVVRVFITRTGLGTLRALDGPVRDLHVAQLGAMKRGDLRELSRLLALAREAALAEWE